MRVRSRSEIVGLRRQRGFLGGMGPAASGGISALPEIGHSLRFNSADSAYATMVPAVGYFGAILTPKEVQQFRDMYE
jgi:hypothetical protein